VTSGGVVLAAHGVALDELAADLDPSERPVPTLAAITDPVVVAMRSLFGAGDERVAAAMTVAGEAYRYDARVVANLSGQRVLLLTAVPERELYRAAHQQALRGALTTGALTLLGLLLAFAISASLAHHRRKRRLGRGGGAARARAGAPAGTLRAGEPLGLGRHGRSLPGAAHAAGARRRPQAHQVARPLARKRRDG
jgi:hypothetical protein